MSRQRIIVTGATGFLGGAVVRDLIARGDHVIALGRNASRLSELNQQGAETISLDLGTKDAPLPDLSADSMVHTAALSSPWARKSEFESANIAGTKTALRLAKQSGAERFVHISTPSIYFDFKDQIGVREDHPLPKPVNHYARTKWVAETLVADCPHISPVILRPRGLYGAGDTSLLPRLMRAAALRALPLMNNGATATDLTHVDDVASAVLVALDRSARKGVQADQAVYNISGGEALNIREVVEAVAERSGITAKWRKVPSAVVLAYARAAEAMCKALPHYPEPAITAYSAGMFAFTQTLDISAAKVGMGWSPNISFQDGLERTFARAPR